MKVTTLTLISYACAQNLVPPGLIYPGDLLNQDQNEPSVNSKAKQRIMEILNLSEISAQYISDLEPVLNIIKYESFRKKQAKRADRQRQRKNQKLKPTIPQTPQPRQLHRCEEPINYGTPCIDLQNYGTRLFHYNINDNTCVEFKYEECTSGTNKFSTFQECRQTCGDIYTGKSLLQTKTFSLKYDGNDINLDILDYYDLNQGNEIYFGQ